MKNIRSVAPTMKGCTACHAIEEMLTYRGKDWESIILRGDNSTERWTTTLKCRYKCTKSVGFIQALGNILFYWGVLGVLSNLPLGLVEHPSQLRNEYKHPRNERARPAYPLC